MAVTINASTSSGLIQTADTSGVLQLQTSNTTALTIDASQNATFAGTVTATGGFVNPSMTLLGTVTPTVSNSINTSGTLTLTSYKALFISFYTLGVTAGSNLIYISSSNVQSGGGISTGSNSANGALWIDLSTGALGGSSSQSSVQTPASLANIPVVGGLTNVTTSTTTIYFRQSSTNTFTATGLITIYGVK
jgi:hypothetical protein